MSSFFCLNLNFEPGRLQSLAHFSKCTSPVTVLVWVYEAERYPQFMDKAGYLYLSGNYELDVTPTVET